MRTAKEIIKDRRIIEEKLTQAEISYNKINFVKIKLIDELKQVEKTIERSSGAGKTKLLKDLDRLLTSMQKEVQRLEKIQEKKFETKELKKQAIYAKKEEIKKIKKSIRLQEIRIKKYVKTTITYYKTQASNLEKKIEEFKPERDEKKELVKMYKKQYKEIQKE